MARILGLDPFPISWPSGLPDLHPGFFRLRISHVVAVLAPALITARVPDCPAGTRLMRAQQDGPNR
jgi:hypothetical protein